MLAFFQQNPDLQGNKNDISFLYHRVSAYKILTITILTVYNLYIVPDLQNTELGITFFLLGK